MKLTVPPLPLSAVPLPAPSSRMICAGAGGRLHDIERRAGRGGRSGRGEVILPVWLLSPMVTVPVASRKDLGQLGAGQIDPRHGGVVRAADLHRPRLDRRLNATPPSVAAEVLTRLNSLTVLPISLVT